MAIGLDHLFICTAAGAPEADRLVDFGLSEGASNRHPGQGTANRRFFFRNAMLELFWVHDAAEAQSEAVEPMQLWQRWSERNTSASPFGVGLRPASPDSTDAPFPAWEYRPPYLVEPWAFHIGADTPLVEPLWFFLAFGRRPDAEQGERRQPLEHATDFREISGVQITIPGMGGLSQVAQAVVQAQVVSVRPGREHLLEITFDGEQHGKQCDFRPLLPLVFHW